MISVSVCSRGLKSGFRSLIPEYSEYLYIVIRFVYILLFIVSAGASATGIILATRLRKRYGPGIFAPLLYFQVFIYTFGFYGIWGQVAIDLFLGQSVSQELLQRLHDIAMLLSLPFLIFAWYMLIRFTGGLAGIATGRFWFIAVFLLVNSAVMLLLVFIIAGDKGAGTGNVMSGYYIIMNLIHYLLAAYLIHFPWKGQNLIHDHDRKIVAPVLFIIMMIQCVPVMFMERGEWPGMIFIFGFFAGNLFLPVYFSWFTLAHSFASSKETVTTGSFDEFCRKYKISPRESEVIMEICNGLSNKEISEKLFISLQTVKDHSHHIYIKTNVKSRVQLINLVKDEV